MHHGLVPMQRVLAGIHIHPLGVGEPTRDHVERKQGDGVGAAVLNPLGVAERIGHAHQDGARSQVILGWKMQTHDHVAVQDVLAGADFGSGVGVLGVVVAGGCAGA